MLTFRTINALINAYDELWEKTPGWLFEKALGLFTEYCGYGKWTTRYWSNHKTMVAEVIALYHTDDGYLKKHEHTLAYNIGFLLFQITLRIPPESIDKEGGLAAIFQVIFNKTQIDPYKFYHDTPLLHAFHAKHPDFNQTVVNYKSWDEFILQYASDFPPELAIGKSGYAHPVNPDSLELLINNKLWEHNVYDTYKNKKSSEEGEISFLLSCSFMSFYWISSNNFTDLFDRAVASLSYNSLAIFFELALRGKNHAVAFYLFCHAFQLQNPYHYSEISGKIHSNDQLMTEIFNVINGPIDSPLFIQLINNGVAIKSWHSYDDYKAYFAMCAKHHLIKDFTTLEAAYIERYEPDINHVYIEALFSENTQVIESLLKTNRLFLRENDKLSWRFASYCSKNNVTYDPNNGVTFTPLQALFIVASESDSCDLIFIFDTIKRLVRHDPDCVLQLDSMGNSVNYYLKKLQVSSRYKKEQMLIDQISEFITSAPYNNNILTFIYATFAYIPMDIIGVIFGFSMAIRLQKITKAYDELLLATKFYRPVFPDLQHLIPSLDKDEVIHIFETLHKAQHYYSAFYLFCQANNIRHNEKDIDYSKDTLLAICNYIDRPISAVWILKIFDNIYVKYDKNNFSYHTYEKLLSHHDYLALCNKRHFIVGWEAAEKKYFTYFNLDINKAISTELDNKNFTNIPYLLKLKRGQIKDSYYRYSQNQITALQGLMLVATNEYSPKFTIELIEKLIVYDKQLISELDDHGHNIYYYFTPLKNSKYATRDNHAKIKNISLLIEQEHRKQYQCSQRNMFFQKLDRYPLLPIADDMLHDDKLPSPV